MKKIFSFSVIVSLVFVLAAPSIVLAAQKSAPSTGIPGSVFQQMPTKDGKALTPEQLKAKRQELFNAIDTNKDGILSKNEMLVHERTV